MTLHTATFPVRSALAVSALAAALSFFASHCEAAQTSDPPGMVEVEGGSRMVLGEEQEVIDELIREVVERAPNLAGEVPQQKVAVADFYLMATEVTNEQYLQFVEATGHKVPLTWGEAAINAAQKAFSDEQGLRIQEAKEAGEPIPERNTFDREGWWDANWSTAEWVVPRGQETWPVAYVDYSDVEAYCAWAGFRPMTEAEFQAAGRGEEPWSYPWGEDWDGARAHTSQERNQGDPRPVGSFPGGATESGLFDLVGNVWEWTSSPYVAYDRYRPWDVEVGSGRTKRDVDAMAEWNADRRVVVGGSFQNSAVAARLTTRRPTDRDQRTNALGFRCAASLEPVVDKARYAVDRVPRELRPDDGFLVDGALGFDRWHATEGRADVPNYAVVTGYEHFLWTPAEKLAANNSSRLLDQSLREGRVAVGMLSTSVPLAEPALEPGTYVVAWRGKGKPRGDDEEVDEKEEDPAAEQAQAQDEAPQEVPTEPLFDQEVENAFFLDGEGAVVAVLPLGTALDYTRPDRKEPNGALAFEPFSGDEQAVEKLAEQGRSPTDLVRLTAPIASETTKVFVLQLPLRFERGTLDDTWRR